MASGRGPSHRSFAAQRPSRGTPCQRGRRSSNSRQTRRQRSRPGLGRAAQRCEGAAKFSEARAQDRASFGAAERTSAEASAAVGDRRRFLRTSCLPRFTQDDFETRRQACRCILGFANFLLKFYRTEQPRAVLVGWDTVDAPTYRHEQFPAYQSGREFDDELLEQLDALPQFVAACGFANAKASGYEADDFLASAAAAEERRGGTVLVASGDRDAFQLASPSTTI